MNAHILVVEDDPAMRDLLVKVLRRARYKVVVAASGSAAVQLLAKSRFDLLVSDIRMSPMDGLALASTARAVSPTTRILLITAYGEEGDARRARAAGADDYMEKPFSLDKLMATVRALVPEPRRGEGGRMPSAHR